MARRIAVQRCGAYLATPDLDLRLVALPAYSPDFNADEAIWDWAREEVTANTCFGTAAKVREKLDAFFAGLAKRTAEVQRRCRTTLQAQADALMATANQLFAHDRPCRSHLGFSLGRPPDPQCALATAERRGHPANLIN